MPVTKQRTADTAGRVTIGSQVAGRTYSVTYEDDGRVTLTPLIQVTLDELRPELRREYQQRYAAMIDALGEHHPDKA